MSKANILSGVSLASSQSYLDLTLTAIRRIILILNNLKGYPPYKPFKVPSYTNAQILYYLHRGQITDYVAF